MEEFKFIYWWEWGHRQLARFIGLLWLIGFLIFWIRKQIPERWTFYFFVLAYLALLQAFLGWWMVSSGLDGQVVDVFIQTGYPLDYGIYNPRSDLLGYFCFIPKAQ